MEKGASSRKRGPYIVRGFFQMANAASILVRPTLLPDQISKILSDITISYTPANSSEGWYYQLTDVTTSSTDLISEITCISSIGAFNLANQHSPGPISIQSEEV